MTLVIKSRHMLLYTREGGTETPVAMPRSMRNGVYDWLLTNRPRPWADDVLLTPIEARELLEELGLTASAAAHA